MNRDTLGKKSFGEALQFSQDDEIIRKNSSIVERTLSTRGKEIQGFKKKEDVMKLGKEMNNMELAQAVGRKVHGAYRFKKIMGR